VSAFRAEFDRGTARPAERCPMPPDRSTHRPADRKDDYQEFLGLFSGSHSRLQAYIRSLVPDAGHAEASDLHYDNRQLPVTTVAVLRNDGSQANPAATPVAADRDIEAVRRSDCGNKVRQIALAMQSYHDANKTFPFGQRCRIGWFVYTDKSEAPFPQTGKTRSNDLRTWMVMISPFVEMTNVYSDVMKTVNLTASTLPDTPS
jgi:hypothetical protein